MGKRKPNLEIAKETTKTRRTRVFKSKPLDLATKICVRLDSKTEIWTAPGYDINKLRLKYLKK